METPIIQEKNNYQTRKEKQSQQKETAHSEKRTKKLIRFGIFTLIFCVIIFAIGRSVWKSQKDIPSLAIAPYDHIAGDPSAKIILIEYGDFQCPACKTVFPFVKNVKRDFGSDVLVIFRNFPLAQHQNALIAALAAEAAGKQGKFFEMHDLLFEKQADWAEEAQPYEKLLGYALSLGIDKEKFLQDLQSKDLAQKIENDYRSGERYGVDATPTFFLQGKKIAIPQSYAVLRDALETTLKEIVYLETFQNKGFHEHVDFKVYLNNVPYDFSQARYQSTKDRELDLNVHLHDKNGAVIHLHAPGVNLKTFFQSLGMELLDDCLTLEAGQKFCAKFGKNLRVFANGEEIKNFTTYQPRDLDKILAAFGDNSDLIIAKQINSIGNEACIYSKKCPTPKGFKTTENCSVGEDCKIE